MNTDAAAELAGMRKYLIMPERCRFYVIEAMSAEVAYRGVCCWYSEKTPVAVMDIETGEAEIYTGQLDQAGNLVQIRMATPELLAGWDDRGRLSEKGPVNG